MTVASNLTASWVAFEHAGMLKEASWKAPSSPAVPGKVFLDAPGEILIDGVATNDYSAVYRISDWPTVREGDTVTVGDAYRVRLSLALEDGLLARVVLSKRQ